MSNIRPVPGMPDRLKETQWYNENKNIFICKFPKGQATCGTTGTLAAVITHMQREHTKYKPFRCKLCKEPIASLICFNDHRLTCSLKPLRHHVEIFFGDPHGATDQHRAMNCFVVLAKKNEKEQHYTRVANAEVTRSGRAPQTPCYDNADDSEDIPAYDIQRSYSTENGNGESLSNNNGSSISSRDRRARSRTREPSMSHRPQTLSQSSHHQPTTSTASNGVSAPTTSQPHINFFNPGGNQSTFMPEYPTNMNYPGTHYNASQSAYSSYENADNTEAMPAYDVQRSHRTENGNGESFMSRKAHPSSAASTSNRRESRASSRPRQQSVCPGTSRESRRSAYDATTSQRPPFTNNNGASIPFRDRRAPSKTREPAMSQMHQTASLSSHQQPTTLTASSMVPTPTMPQPRSNFLPPGMFQPTFHPAYPTHPVYPAAYPIGSQPASSNGTNWHPASASVVTPTTPRTGGPRTPSNPPPSPPPPPPRPQVQGASSEELRAKVTLKPEKPAAGKEARSQIRYRQGARSKSPMSIANQDDIIEVEGWKGRFNVHSRGTAKTPNMGSNRGAAMLVSTTKEEKERREAEERRAKKQANDEAHEKRRQEIIARMTARQNAAATTAAAASSSSGPGPSTSRPSASGHSTSRLSASGSSTSRFSTSGPTSSGRSANRSRSRSRSPRGDRRDVHGNQNERHHQRRNSRDRRQDNRSDYGRRRNN